MNGIQVASAIPSIKKRSGAIVTFDQDKITHAITKALKATGQSDESIALKISDRIVEKLISEISQTPEKSIPTVEHIQDIVEEELMKSGYMQTAKAYILYRQKHNEERQLKRAMLGMDVDTKVSVNQLRVLKERYLLRDGSGKVIETPEQLFQRVAHNIAEAELQYNGSQETVKEWTKRYEQMMENMEFMPNTPTLMNAGTDIQQLSACFVLPVEDSLEGIYETMKHQALIHQSGGGTGFSFSRLRPAGSMVKSTKGVATGPVGFMSVYNASTEIIKQGGKRRGANMGILRCLSGNTLISTLTGKKPINELVGQKPLLYCLNEKKEIRIRKALNVIYNGKRKLIRIHFDDDSWLDCTEDHRIMLANGEYREAGKLQQLDSIMAFHKRVNNERYDLGSTAGKNIAEHLAAMEYKKGIIVEEKEGRTSESLCIHHIDENPLNNAPENLELLTVSEHAKRHLTTLLVQQQRIANDRKGKTLEEVYGKERVEQWKRKMSDARKGKASWNKGITSNQYLKHYPDGIKNQYSNHKVVSIEELIGEHDVYDIQMPEFHNFVANDIFVHNCDHPDIHEFIHCKDDITKINNFNISVALTEKFMQAVEKNEEFDLIDPHTKQTVRKENARTLYDELVMSAWKTGDPGIIFIDRINRDNPVPHIHEIEATNPCVTGDTLVNTEKGLIRMKELVEIFSKNNIRVTTDNRIPIKIQQENGTFQLLENKQMGVSFNWISNAFQTGIKDVYKLETQAGYEIECTANHQIFTNDGFIPLSELSKNKHVVFIQSAEGKFNDDSKLPFSVANIHIGKNRHQYQSNFPQEWSKELGQVIGWLIGDGWLRIGDKNCRVGFTFSQDDTGVLTLLKPILNKYYGKGIQEVERENGVYHLSYHSKYFSEFFHNLGVMPSDSGDKIVPESIYQATRPAVIGFLQGLFTADGTIGYPNAYARLTSKSIHLLKGVQLLLLNLGIKSRIYDRTRKERILFHYTTIHGKNKHYTSDGVYYELNISGDGLRKFIQEIGFIGNKHASRIEKIKTRPFVANMFIEKVKSITPVGKKEVFDLTEPVTHSFIGNGVMYKNCGEQPLGPYDSCNLGSINLAKFAENGEINWNKLRETIRKSVRFLDNTIDMNKYPIPQIEKMNKGNRRIGLGVMGWADVLFKLGIAYNSKEGCEFAEKMAKFIREEADAMSQELGKEKGTFPHYKGSIYDKPNGPMFRNCTRITIAPTGTISMIADCSSGIEPLFAISFVKRVMDGQELLYVNEDFKKTAMQKGFYSEELMEKIAQEGTIQHLEEIPPEVRKVFVTAHDISPEWHLRMQAAWQKYTDNAISKTVNFTHDATIEEVKEVYMLAYKLGCKGVTIYRDGSKGFDKQVLNLNVKGKSSKEIEESYKEKILNNEEEAKKNTCPKCQSKLHQQEGCATCMNCGYSVCLV